MATGRNGGSRAPRCCPSTRRPGRRRAPRVHCLRVRARWWRPGWHRRVHGGRAVVTGGRGRTGAGGRGVRTGSGTVRYAGALLRHRGTAGARWQWRLRASPSVGAPGRATLVVGVVGLARHDPLPGHRRNTGPGRGGGAGAFVTLVVAHAASPRPRNAHALKRTGRLRCRGPVRKEGTCCLRPPLARPDGTLTGRTYPYRLSPF